MFVDFISKARHSLVDCILCKLPTHIIINKDVIFMPKYHGCRILIGVSPNIFPTSPAHCSHITLVENYAKKNRCWIQLWCFGHSFILVSTLFVVECLRRGWRHVCICYHAQHGFERWRWWKPIWLRRGFIFGDLQEDTMAI